MTYEVGGHVRIARSGKFITLPCAKCEKETPHRKAQCIYCGSVPVNPRAEKFTKLREETAAKSYKRRMIDGAIAKAAVSRDKREARKRAAEESRRKWEST